MLIFLDVLYFNQNDKVQGNKVMSMMVAELYDALKDAGASEEAAKKAATALADYESRFDLIDRSLLALQTELAMVKWLVGGIGFGVLLLVIKSFLP
jgi:hypothetical protein